jgi:hypothetical protein
VLLAGNNFHKNIPPNLIMVRLISKSLQQGQVKGSTATKIIHAQSLHAIQTLTEVRPTAPVRRIVHSLERDHQLH